MIADGTSDAVVSKVFDFLAQKFEAGHVRLHRVGELRRLLEDAGLERAEARFGVGSTGWRSPGRRLEAPDLDCSDLGGPVQVGRGDPHTLDADGDGTGCD